MARIITAFVAEKLNEVHKGKISLSKFVELLNQEAEKQELTEHQASLNVDVMFRQCGITRNGNTICFGEKELKEWFQKGLQYKNFNEYDNL